MNKLRLLFQTCVAAAAFVLALPAARANDTYSIHVQPGAGNVSGILSRETELHLNAIRRVVLSRPAFHTDSIFMSNFQQRLWASTIARFDYTYTKDGRTFTRRYHARSGQSIYGTMDIVSSTSSGSDSGSGSSGPSRGELDIQADLRESQYYPADTAEDVRVRNLPAKGSTVQFNPNEYNRARDAELKALRHIEHDIKQGTVTEGGKLTAYVSQPPCDSCANAIRNFSRQYRINGDVYHLVPKATISGPVTPEIADSIADAAKYFSARRRTIKNVLVTGHVTVPESTSWDTDSTRTLNAVRDTEQGIRSQTCRS